MLRHTLPADELAKTLCDLLDNCDMCPLCDKCYNGHNALEEWLKEDIKKKENEENE